MNEYVLEKNKKKHVLVLVEGEHEKAIFMKLLLKVFPKLPMKLENIHVYGTDIYELYYLLENEYGANWYEAVDEVDIPGLISRREGIEPKLDGRAFTDIILMFDLEKHDNWYSDDKILRLQQFFNSSTDSGILYINYPMIEAYQHISAIPDPEFLDRTCPASMKNGHEYKKQVAKDSLIVKYIKAYQRLQNRITDTLRIQSEEQKKEKTDGVLDEILSLVVREDLHKDIEAVLRSNDVEDCKTLAYAIEHQITDLPGLKIGDSFWSKLCEIYRYTVEQNIKKAWRIQEAIKNETLSVKERYHDLDWLKLLKRQIETSRSEEDDLIWVLCSFITILGEYKFFWESIGQS